MNDILGDLSWHVEQEDCITHMASMPPACIDFSVFSPPFPSLYAYTSEECDSVSCTASSCGGICGTC